MRRLFSAMVLCVGLVSSSLAGSISGVVLDSITGKPVVGAKVSFLDESITDTALTDSLGRFSIETPVPTIVRQGPVSAKLADSRQAEMFDLRGRKFFGSLADRSAQIEKMRRTASGVYVMSGRKLLLPFSKDNQKAAVLSGSGSSVLAKRAGTSYDLVFEKWSYQSDTISASDNISDLEVLLGLPPFSAYRIHGMNFSPYMNGQNPNTGVFIPEDQIAERMRLIVPHTRVMRTFSTTHGLEVCGRIAHDYGLIAYVGAWIGRNGVINKAEVDSLIAMAKRGEVDTAIIGSEAMLRRDVTEAALIAMIERFRDSVPDVPVTTADVYGELLLRPNLIAACDFVYGNFYPYWEGAKIDYAVANLHSSYEGLQAISGGKEVLISEAGWPSEGAVYGQAVPSLENAAFYFLNFISWARAESVKVFYFEAFDEAWKTNEGTVGPHWGLFDTAGVMKEGMQPVFDGDTMEQNWRGDVLIDGPGDPEIAFTYVPKYGTTENLEGKVSHVIPKEYGVVVYIKVGNGWWIKPTFASPVTRINVDGSWICDVTTGGYDTQAVEYRAILIPAGYTPPSSMSSFPANKIIAEVSVTRSAT